MAKQKYTITETGLTVHAGWTPELWEEVGHKIAGLQRGLQWMIGDWLRAGQNEGYIKRGRLAEACDRFGIAYDTAKQASRVAAAFPEQCGRQHYLSFEHHRIVANDPNAAKLLKWAESKGASVKQLRIEKQRREASATLKRSKAKGRKGKASWQFQVGDCQSIPYPDDHFDLVFCSPPYETQRAYADCHFDLAGEAWVLWAADCYMECLRVCSGLVAWVVEGSTENFAYSSAPMLLQSELHRRGVQLRKPVIFQRQGIPGSGGPDWLRNDYEVIVCGTKNGRLPWADNTACGQPPQQQTTRNMTNRNRDGSRCVSTYVDPELANPGNVISGIVGKNGMGWADATQNEAPFPEWLAEFFIRSFCPPGGSVLDPFSGSGTTVSVAVTNGRNGVGVDVRESQVWLGETRLMGLSVAERRQADSKKRRRQKRAS